MRGEVILEMLYEAKACIPVDEHQMFENIFWGGFSEMVANRVLKTEVMELLRNSRQRLEDYGGKK